jgi:hypothetical protein
MGSEGGEEVASYYNTSYSTYRPHAYVAPPNNPTGPGTREAASISYHHPVPSTGSAHTALTYAPPNGSPPGYQHTASSSSSRSSPQMLSLPVVREGGIRYPPHHIGLRSVITGTFRYPHHLQVDSHAHVRSHHASPGPALSTASS